jgi:hypothetical protein
MSPLGVASLLGSAQWFCLPSRPHHSVFDTIYQLARRKPVKVRTTIPKSVSNEMALFTVLAPLLTAALDRQYLPLLTASDASPCFGFGVSVMPCPPEMVADLGRLAGRRGDFIRFPGDSDEKDRIGNPCRLPYAQDDFRDVICVKAKRIEHSSVLEAKALLLLVQLIARQAARQHSRLVSLLDAKAILAATAKGRTCSPAVRGTICAINSYLLACDILLRPLFVPSENMPADRASRGIRKRPACRRLHKVTHTKLDKWLQRRQKSVARLTETGMLD